MNGSPSVQWSQDRILPEYQYATLELVEPALAVGEPEDAVITAGLVRRNPPTHQRAVLYLHGWSDYFFQTWLADYFHAQGVDFYALELRRYGRNLAEGQLGGFTTDLADYYEEVDAAFAVLAADHDSVTLMGHSTGGLLASLWAHDHPGKVHGLILNSPWLDFQGSPVLRSAVALLGRNVGRDANWSVRTIPQRESNTYLRSIHASLDGEWPFDLGLKRHPSFLVRAGWATAIATGHERVRAGLAIDTPVLTMISQRSDFARTWHVGQLAADTVLDVDKIARRAHQLGPHVTLVRINDGLHDLVLSRPEVREMVWRTITQWSAAWLTEGTPDVAL